MMCARKVEKMFLDNVISIMQRQMSHSDANAADVVRHGRSPLLGEYDVA